MIKEKTLKKITIIILILLFVIGSTVMVFAATTYSGWKEKTGDGYTPDYVYSTPMASITGAGLQTEKISNSNCNYAKILGEEVKMPEMVPVRKQDGTTGFVRFEDISPEANTIEEALEITKRAAYDQIVPMYNEDGEIIGEWIIPAMNHDELTEIINELGY